MRAALSGANVLTLIEKDIRTPNGLAIDHRAEKLYFSDATLDKIERCEYDGSQRYVSLQGWWVGRQHKRRLGQGTASLPRHGAPKRPKSW
jgi:sugar lactone lactonase YvrE